MENQEINLSNDDIIEEISCDQKYQKKINMYHANKIVFRVMAILIFVISVSCGIIFSFTETTMLTKELLVMTTKSFEVWRAVLFFIVGLSGGASLWSVSEVFNMLDAKSK